MHYLRIILHFISKSYSRRCWSSDQQQPIAQHLPYLHHSTNHTYANRTPIHHPRLTIGQY